MPADVALPWVVLAALATLAALVQTARLVGQRWLRRLALRARFARALAGEHLAEGLLRQAGYAIHDRQVAGSWTLRADGAPVTVALRADLVVSRAGRRYVAEVKTGRLAPRLDHAPTRRQLLEYRVAFDVDGVLLVDAEAGRIVEVELGLGPGAGRRSGGAATWLAALAFGLLAGVAVGLAAAR